MPRALRAIWARMLAGVLACMLHGISWADLPDTIVRIKPGIVAIGSYQRMRAPQFEFSGTGFAVGDGSLVVTNAHVVARTLNDIRLETWVALAPAAGRNDGEIIEATVLETDKEHDLALLKLKNRTLPPLKLGDMAQLREGLRLAMTGFPIGNVLGVFPATHTMLVAALAPIAIPAANGARLDARLIRRLAAGTINIVQLDGTAYPGNSGSPLYDMETGEVYAVLNMTLVKSTKESAITSPSGISYAIPVSFVRELLQQAR
ncbi:MAG: trypsin-like peptidase domain-containing protein [Rhodocyclaceae bacterium]|nr:trypsin-like peptidase domain-containing protein [Rhodocyclaceae bacterium]MBX3667621.1 trypsin-like peptidase domain-containing protein [Rhodocyclaceae bacterium]